MAKKILGLLCICVLLAAALPSAWAGENNQRDRAFTVMTRNMDLGTDFGLVFEALADHPGDQLALLFATTATFQEVLASNIPARAQALAAEIEAVQPDLISLQEVSTIKTGPFPGLATTVVEDQLQSLLDALDARGLHYTALVVQENSDASLPAFDSSFNLVSVGVADHDVVLARDDLPVPQFTIQNIQNGYYANVLNLTIAGIPFALRQGWIAVDVKLRGKVYRLVDTHLNTLSPAIQAAQTAELLNGPLATGLPLILAGDLNSDAHAPSFAKGPAYGLLVDAGLVDVWKLLHPTDPGFTWPLFLEDPPAPSVPFERIDLILTKGAINATQITRTGTAPPFASDHAGVAATLVVLP